MISFCRAVLSCCARIEIHNQLRAAAALCFATLSLTLFGNQTYADYLPSIRIGTAALIDPGDADTQWYKNSTTATDGLKGITGNPTPIPPEITELARALNSDPTQTVDRVYQYVHNNIQTVWMYGLQKGALGAEIDKSGTPFDQAELMVALLSLNGIQATYIAGTITLSQAQFAAWTNITKARAACWLLSAGGIPAQINGTSTVTCGSFNANTNITSVTMAHIWVKVTITGSSCTKSVCVFDPSYKAYSWRPGIDLYNATGLVAGAPIATATTGMNSGTITSGAHTVPYINTLNDTGLNTSLQGYATSLLSYMNSNGLHGAQIEDIVGGKVMAPEFLSIRQSTLPYSATEFHTWAANPTTPEYRVIPDQYRTTLRVRGWMMAYNQNLDPTDTQMFDLTFYVDEIYGRRLTLDTDFNAGISETTYTQNNVSLDLDGVSLRTYQATFPIPGDSARGLPTHLEMWANHPYAAADDGTATIDGTYMDDYVDKHVVLVTPLTIVHGWGDVSPALFTKWSDELASDTPLPRMLYPPECPGGQGELCPAKYTGPTGGFQRSRIAANWLAQYTRAAQLNADVAKSIVQLHHVIGVVYADTAPLMAVHPPYNPSKTDWVLTDSFDRLDIDAGLSLAMQNTDSTVNAGRRGAVRAIAAAAATLEGSINAQMADTPDTASTATRFSWGNDPPTGAAAGHQVPANFGPQNFLTFTSGNAPVADNVVQVDGRLTPPNPCNTQPAWNQQPTVCNYTDWLASLYTTIQSYAQASPSFTVTASQEAFLGPGQRGGTIIPHYPAQGGQPDWYSNETPKQRGGALVATRYDSNDQPVEIAHIITGQSPLIYGDTLYTKGGGGGVEPDNKTTYNPAEAADILKSRFIDRSNLLGVNLSNGSLAYTSPVSLSVGNGGFPYELSASLNWRAGPAPAPEFGPIALTEPQPGWTTSWHNNLSRSGSGLEAMGQSDVRAAAATIAAFLAAQDIYGADSSDGESTQETAGLLVQAWWANQITGNVITVQVGASTRQFLRYASGTWGEPGAEFASLDPTGSRQQFEYRCQFPYQPPYALARGWDYSNMSFTVTNTHGDTQSFGYWLNTYATDDVSNCGQLKGFRLTNWTSPQGPSATVTYGNAYNSIDQLVKVTNSSGRTIGFSETNGLIANLTNGLSGADARSIAVPFQQDAAPEIPNMTDQLLNSTSFTYLPAQGTSATQRPVPYAELSTVTTPDNPAQPNVHYFYDSLGRIDEVEDAVAIQQGGRAPYRFYLADGTRGERDDPLGQPWAVDYDTYGHPARYTDELGAITLALYDSRGLPLQYIYPEGDCEAFAYDTYKNTTDLWRVDTASGCNTGAGSGHVLHASAAYNHDWNKPYNVTDFRRKTTTINYNPAGVVGASLPSLVTRPDIAEGTPQYQYFYLANGKLDYVTDSDLIETKNFYDGSDNLTKTVLDYGTGSGHLNLATQFGYDAQGDVTSTTDPRGIYANSCYDLARRKTETDHHDGGSGATLIAAEQTIYDVLGRDHQEKGATAFSSPVPCSGQNPSSGITWQTNKTTTYTPTSKVQTVTDADNRTTTNSYDDADRLYLITDPIGRNTRFSYCNTTNANCAANQVRVEYRAWASTLSCNYGSTLQQCYRRMTYGLDGEQATIEDANSNITAYGYDGFVRLTKTTFPDSTFEQLTLDSNGNVTQRVNRAGETLSYEYNALNWITQKCIPTAGASCPSSPAVTDYWTYLLSGKVNTVCEASDCSSGNKVDYNYDSAGRLDQVITHILGFADDRGMTYTLDADGNRIQLQWPQYYGGYTVNYCYDNLNRMSGASENPTDDSCNTGTPLATYSYDPLSRRQSLTYGNGASMAYTYTKAGDLLTLNHNMLGTGNDPHYTFTYTNAHEVQTESITDPDYVWQPSTTPGTASYAAANNLNQYPSYTPPGIAPSPRTLGYDARGNLTSGNLDGSGAWAFGYDPENRLTSACKPVVAGACTGTVNAAYAYDPLGRRNHKSGAGVNERYFLLDGDDDVLEFDGGKNVVAFYVPGPAIDEPIVKSVPNGSGGYTHEYFHTNHQGSVIAMSDDSAALAEGPFLYDPYGNCFKGSTPCASLTGSIPYKFTGRRLDEETGLYYYRARCYSPTLGRFCQTDPVGYTADLNLYTYVGNDPTNRTDPHGLAACVTGSRLPGGDTSQPISGCYDDPSSEKGSDVQPPLTGQRQSRDALVVQIRNTGKLSDNTAVNTNAQNDQENGFGVSDQGTYNNPMTAAGEQYSGAGASAAGFKYNPAGLRPGDDPGHVHPLGYPRAISGLPGIGDKPENTGVPGARTFYLVSQRGVFAIERTTVGYRVRQLWGSSLNSDERKMLQTFIGRWNQGLGP